MTNTSIRKIIEKTRARMTDRSPARRDPRRPGLSEYSIMCSLGLLSDKFPAYDASSYIGLIKNQVRAYNDWFKQTIKFGFIPSCIKDESMIGNAVYTVYQKIRDETGSDDVSPSDDLVMMEYARIYNKMIQEEKFYAN